MNHCYINTKQFQHVLFFLGFLLISANACKSINDGVGWLQSTASLVRNMSAKQLDPF